MRGAVALSLLFLGCGAGLHDGVFSRGGVRYRVAALDEKTWKKVDFAENDLAWISTRGHLLAMNATCTSYGDPSLEVLTTHLLFGFTDRELMGQRTMEVDGREALRSWYHAKMDGVPIELELLLLKKNGCVHDFTYICPAGEGAISEGDFERLVAGFKQEASP